MPSGLVIGLALIPSMFFVYVILTTFYGANRAYVAISWLPLAFLLTIWAFTRILSFQHLSNQWWLDLADTVRWVTWVQVALGLGLVARALWRRKVAIAVAIATVLTASPLFVRLAL